MLTILVSACMQDWEPEGVVEDTSSAEDLQLKRGTITRYEPDVNFGLSVKYDDGKHPSVGVNSKGIVVEVHQEKNKQTLYYRIGKTVMADVEWETASKYTSGKFPVVDINDNNLVVEVHESVSDRKLYSRAGICNGTEISWGDDNSHDTGEEASVALNNDGWCILVHKSQIGKKLYYSVGKLDENGKTIDWTRSIKYDTGYRPKIAVNSSGVVVEVHRSAQDGALWFRKGFLNTRNKKIYWTATAKLANGFISDVAIDDNGMVVAVFKVSSSYSLRKLTGKVSGKSITWKDAVFYDNGTNPSVAMAADGSVVLQVHNSGLSNELLFSSSLLIDRARWMESEYNVLANKKLREICLPGSHDAGAYRFSRKLTSCADDILKIVPKNIVKNYALAQEMDIAEQLNAGIRYFDLRPYCENGEFYIHHSLVGVKMESLLQDFSSYLSTIKKELIIIKVSHFCNFNSEQHKVLAYMFYHHFNNYLYKGTGSIPETEFGTFVNDGPCVILWYENSTVCDSWDGFYRNIGVYDRYSNTEDYNSMKDDQLAKLKSVGGSSGRLFLLSWTLTPDEDVNLATAVGSLRKLSEEANRNLRDFVAEYGKEYQINILYNDFVEDAASVDCAVMQNRQ